MDWTLMAIAVLLMLSGLYFLEATASRSPVVETPNGALKAPRNAAEIAWLHEPLAVFMRQLLAARRRRYPNW